MMRLTRRFAFVALAAALACGDDDPAGPTEPVDVTGTWNATGTSAGGAFTLVLTLTQTGTTVTGTGRVLNGPAGTVTGDVSGNRFTFELQIGAPCAGDYDGTATITGETGRTMNGSVQGTDCAGNRTASFTGLKQ